MVEFARIVVRFQHNLISVNSRNHWSREKRARIAKAERTMVRRALQAYCSPPMPIKVEILRFGKRLLDSDNLVASAKHVRDGVADWLGVDDSDPRIGWEVKQEKAGVFALQVSIDIGEASWQG